VKDVRYKARMIRAFIGLGMLVSLLVAMTGCWWLINAVPVASFTTSALSGTAPLTVNSSAILSSDEDGFIAKWEWDFGDGSSGSGESVSHTYTTAGTFTVVLRVTDDDGATDTASKTITVLPAEPPGPTASFTASPSSGSSPLVVRFDASASSYDKEPLTYSWDFGDGHTGFGKIVTHMYISSSAKTYTATLTVKGPDNKEGTATKNISITGPGGGTPAAGSPSARFNIDESIGVAPLQVNFDPSASKAAEGKTLALFVWSFGDGDATSDINAAQKTHVYTTDDPSEVFSVMLLVLDNESADDSITKTVKVYNHQPVAGFEIANPPGGDIGDPGAVHNFTGNWEDEDVWYGDLDSLGAFPQNVTVVIRSQDFNTQANAAWFALDGTQPQGTLMTATTSATSSATPTTPAGYNVNTHNYSYDPEGQDWVGAPPAWFTNQAWGIRYLYVDWGDGTPEEQFDYAVETTNYTVDAIMMHTYTFGGGTATKTITIRVVDFLGADASFSRKVYLKAGEEAANEL